MVYDFDFRSYAFALTKPLVTNHGSWEVRSGIILKLQEKLEDDLESGMGDDQEQRIWHDRDQNTYSQITYGEIAPISWFGSETLEAALKFCQELPSQITSHDIENIPDRLPATQFGFSSAVESLSSLDIPPFLRGARGDKTSFLRGSRGDQTSLSKAESNANFSYLLPTGNAALNAWQKPWQDGYRTFKWKIGVANLPQELEQLRQLIHTLPAGAKLRLDANGSLNLAQAHLWLQECDRLNFSLNLPHRNLSNSQLDSSPQIEFLEQPLPVDDFQNLLTLVQDYQTSIALDESVATLPQLEACYAQGWRGIFVIKPSIAGYGDRLRNFCRKFNIDAVFSSSLETAIGRTHALRLAQELSNPQRALGFGVDQWLNIPSEELIQQLWQEP
jgi:O-succinylbenzoate synthase